MDGYLRQASASQVRAIGPFISTSDFISAATGLTIANTDIKLRANGTTLSNKNSGGGTHQVNGEYSVTWDATDTANVGQLKYSVVMTGALPVSGTYVVITAAAYDATFGSSAPGYVTDQPVNATKVGGTTQTGRDLGASVLLAVGTGTGQVALSSGAVPVTGDLTATMKTSVGTAVAASAVASVTGNVSGNVNGSVGSVTATVNADVKKINGTTVNGNGGVTPWGP